MNKTNNNVVRFPGLRENPFIGSDIDESLERGNKNKSARQLERDKRLHQRRVIVILGVTAIILCGSAIDRAMTNPQEETGTYIVKPGDNLWNIARQTWPNDLDPRARVYGMDKQLPDDVEHVGQKIQPGDEIQLPAESPIFKSDKTS